TNQNGTDTYSLYPPGAQYIHIDIDSEETGRKYEAMRLHADARETSDALTDALDGVERSLRKAARAGVEQRIAPGKRQHQEAAEAVLHSNASPIRPERLMTELNAVLNKEDIVVSDASYSSFWTVNYLTAQRPGQRFLTPRGMAG